MIDPLSIHVRSNELAFVATCTSPYVTMSDITPEAAAENVRRFVIGELAAELCPSDIFVAYDDWSGPIVVKVRMDRPITSRLLMMARRWMAPRAA